MIRLNRLQIEPTLEAAVNARVAQLQALLAAGQPIPPGLAASYKEQAVKAHLVAEVHGKCMYCESKITHVYFGDIEHIRPKSIFPEDMLTVTNLGLACSVCNNAKGNYWDPAAPILDPYTESPEDQLIAFGFMIARKPGNDRARVTIQQLKLNRAELLQKRRERIELLQPLADQFAVTPDGPIKEIIREELLRHAHESSEFAMIARLYLEAACDLHAPQS